MAQPTRTQRKSKRRKTNRILNTAIAVVVLLIVVVAFTIFSGGEKEEVAQPPKPKTETQQSSANEKDEQSDGVKEEKQNATDEDEEKKEEEQDKEEEVVEKDSDEPNVEKEIVNPNWTGVGTSQSGQHTSSFDSNSVDWQEKKEALAYATGIPQEEMIVWYISGDGPEGAIGTISPKSDPNDAYRVYINWVDGEGWKPVKVHKLEHNDKGR
ncbi:MAG TPA: YrrS family protein [Pseudobacillus sp.]